MPLENELRHGIVLSLEFYLFIALQSLFLELMNLMNQDGGL